jgi:hypothetical protein
MICSTQDSYKDNDMSLSLPFTIADTLPIKFHFHPFHESSVFNREAGAIDDFNLAAGSGSNYFRRGYHIEMLCFVMSSGFTFV